MASYLLRDLASYLFQKPLNLGKYGLDEAFAEFLRTDVPQDVLSRALDKSGLEIADPDLRYWLPQGIQEHFRHRIETGGHLLRVIAEGERNPPGWLTLTPVTYELETVVVFHLTDDPSILERYGFQRGETDFDAFAVQSLKTGEADGPGLSAGLGIEQADRIVGLLEREDRPRGSHAVALLTHVLRVWNSVEGEEQLIFDGSQIDPTCIISLNRCEGGFEVEGKAYPLREAIDIAAKAAVQARKDHEAHSEAMEETGYWGNQGAGCIVVARSTGRVLIGYRSADVLEPFTWGTFGGAIDEDLTPEGMAWKELRQETGYKGAAEMVPLYEYKAPSGTFRYQNFAAVVEDEYEPLLSWEHDEATWFDLEALPDDLHFGLESLLADPESIAFLRSLRPQAAPER